MSKAGANTIEIQNRTYLLGHTGGYATHLVAEAAKGGEASAAVMSPEEYAGPGTTIRIAPAYDAEALLDPRWHPRTLCGREWLMAPGETGWYYDSDHWEVGADLAPDCRRCLAILDKQFPEPEPDERFDWTVFRCLEELELWGNVLIREIPADQADLLRKRLRGECRQRGWKLQTSFKNSILIMLSQDALNPERHEAIRADSMERMSKMWTDEPVATPSWQLVWGH